MTNSAHKTVAIVQARMGSNRLAGKVLALAGGKPLLGWLLDQLLVAESVDEVVVAIPNGDRDQPIAAYCLSRSIRCVSGPEDDVLTRYRLAVRASAADTALRITSDCPLLDAATVDRNVLAHRASGAEYSFNEVPQRVPRGYDVEVIERPVFERLDKLSTMPEEREHVTLYLHRHPESFRIHHFRDEQFPEFPPTRLCVDTADDLKVVKHIIESLGSHDGLITPEAVLDLLSREPELLKKNAHVQQKEP